jgi:hypothetical protein
MFSIARPLYQSHGDYLNVVTPANAGVQGRTAEWLLWIPACAGMTM